MGISIIIGLVLALFFLSGNLTGYTIANINQTSSTWIGLVLLIAGLIGVFFYFKKK